MTASTGHLVTFRNDRLGGRLISLVNTMRLARDHDLPFRVRWHETTDIAEVFNDPRDFFEDTFVADHFLTAAEWNARRHDVVRLRDLEDRTSDGLRRAVAGGVIVLVDGSFGHDKLDDEDPDTVRASAAQTWSDFPLTGPIRAAADALRGRVGDAALGYHVRRGDLISSRRVMNRAWPQKYVFDELYFRHIDRSVKSGLQPILFSDDPETIEHYRERFPALVPASDLHDADGFTEGQRDLLELIAMSWCTRIIAPALSGFSATAATLGGITHSDVVADLSDDEVAQAHEDMVARITSTAPAGPTASGHLAQSLAHAEPWLIERDRRDEAERILSRLIDDGLDISFLYPRLVALRLDLGDVAGALEAHSLVDRREVHYGGDVALADAFACLAAHESGDAAATARLARRALWMGGTIPQVGAIVSALMSLGALDDTNFLPADAATRTLWRHPAHRLPARPGVRRALGADDPAALPPIFSINPLLWDWFVFLRPVPPHQLRQHPHRKQHETGLDRLELAEEPGGTALAALYDALMEADADPLGRLRDAAEAAPETPMVHHRLSVAAAKVRDRALAHEAAERAAQLAPDAPAFIAWRGVTRGQAGDKTGERADLESAIFGSGFTLPRLPLKLAAAGRKAGDTALQARAHDLAVEIAPRDAGSRFARAQFAHLSGTEEAALRDLHIVLRHDVVPPNASALYDRIMRETALVAQK